MITLTHGDILRSDAEAIVNTVNCVGVMGRGIALQFKKAFPNNFRSYAAACKRKEVVPRKMFVFDTGAIVNPRWIINFPTKRHWRGKSRMDDIEEGLVALRQEVEARGIRSIAIPPLGSGLGGLSWDEVKPRIVQAFESCVDIQVHLYEPTGAPAIENVVKTDKRPSMTPGRAVLISLMERYLAGLMDPFISLLEVHKLMYFSQESGQPLKLRFTKAPMGPYAVNLRHVLSEIEGHFLLGYADGGDDPRKSLKILDGASEESRTLLGDDTETQQRIDRVSKLVDGFETPFGLELLASVHWVASREETMDSASAIKAVYDWNARKQRFSREQIEMAWKVLCEQKWIGNRSSSTSGQQ